MFEPPPPRGRPRWFWPAIIAGIILVTIGVAVAVGGGWLFLIVAVCLVWAFFGIRFVISPRGKRILFGRFDERYEPPDR